MIKNEDVKLGQHCWATIGDRLLIVLKAEDEGYDVCGGWECGVSDKLITLLEIINKPVDHEDTTMYYYDVNA